MTTGRFWIVVLTTLALGIAPAAAASINVVALGASNTYGKGVARGQDFPAQLQAMLKARGLDARVTNAGINGDTTAGMLARLSSAVPAGTQIVILQPGGNDRRRGVAAERGRHYREPAGARHQGHRAGTDPRRHVAAAYPAGRAAPDGGGLRHHRVAPSAAGGRGGGWAVSGTVAWH